MCSCQRSFELCASEQPFNDGALCRELGKGLENAQSFTCAPGILSVPRLAPRAEVGSCPKPTTYYVGHSRLYYRLFYDVKVYYIRLCYASKLRKVVWFMLVFLLSLVWDWRKVMFQFSGFCYVMRNLSHSCRDRCLWFQALLSSGAGLPTTAQAMIIISQHLDSFRVLGMHVLGYQRWLVRDDRVHVPVSWAGKKKPRGIVRNVAARQPTPKSLCSS